MIFGKIKGASAGQLQLHLLKAHLKQTTNTNINSIFVIPALHLYFQAHQIL